MDKTWPQSKGDVYTAALSTTRRYQTLNEAIHELLRENKEARLLQSSANEDDRSSHFVQDSPFAHTTMAAL